MTTMFPPIKDPIMVGSIISRIWTRFFTSLASSVSSLEDEKGLNPYESPTTISVQDVQKEIQELSVIINGMTSKIEELSKRVDALQRENISLHTGKDTHELKHEIENLKRHIIMEV